MLLPPEESGSLAILSVTSVDPETQWRGRRDTTRRRFSVLVAVSVLLHLSLTPWASLLGLAKWLPETDDAPPEEALNSIPVDLIADARAPEPAPPPKPLPPPDPKPPPPPPPKPPEPPEPPEPAPPEPAPKAAEPEPPKPEPPEEKPEPAEPQESIGDPVALSGSAGKIADSNANVRLLLYADAIREHRLGPRIGKLLQSTPQWKDFFGPAGIDPIKDIDRVLIAGPQLRDSSNVVAAVQHSLPQERLVSGLDALIARGGGEWVEGSKTKMARTKADRAERLIVIPSKNVVAIMPPSLEKSARTLNKKTSLPPGAPGVAMVAYIKTPWRALMGLPVAVPKSIEWVRVEVRPSDDGGAIAHLIAEDESPEVAKSHAAEIGHMLRGAADLLAQANIGNAISSWLTGSKKSKAIERIEVTSDGKRIVGTIEANRDQLTSIIQLVEGLVDYQSQAAEHRKRERENAKREKEAASASSAGAGVKATQPAPSSDARAKEPDGASHPPETALPAAPQTQGPAAE